MNEENQNVLETIYDYQRESGTDYGIVFADGTYYAMKRTGTEERLASDNAEEYQQEINNRLSRAAQGISRDKENLYQMEATPGYRGNDGEFPFFIQRYHLTEHGQRTPEEIVYMGDAQTASYLTYHMDAGTDYGMAVIENIRLRQTLSLPIKTGEAWLLSSEIEEENLSLENQLMEQQENTQKTLTEQVIVERTDSREMGQTGEVPHGEDGLFTLRLKYREPVSINGWTAETDKITFDSREELNKYISGEPAYDALDNSVRKRDNEILLFAENENGEVIWQPQEQEISSFTAYDGNVYQTLDAWTEQYGEETLDCVIGHSREDGEDYFLATVTGEESGYREYEFDEQPAREIVIGRFADDEAARDVDRMEAEADPTIFVNTENVVDRQPPKEYIYYSLRRPVEDLAYPEDGMIAFENFTHRTYVEEIGREAWAKLTYSRELTPKEIDDYEFAYEEVREEIQPIREFFGEDGKILIGADIGLDEATGQVNREAVYLAVSDFEEQNNIPLDRRIIWEDGDYADRHTLYGGYDIYVGMSHFYDRELAPYRETISMMVEDIDNDREKEQSQWRYAAESYYALKNGLTPEQVEFMLENSAEEQSPGEYMRNIRRAFERGMTADQIETATGQDYYTQQTMLQYLYEDGDLERARAMRGADMATAYYIYRGYKDNGLSADKAASLVKAANALSGAAKEKNRYDEVSQETFISVLLKCTEDNSLTAEDIEKIAADFAAQDVTQNLEDFIQQQGGIAVYYPHGEEERIGQSAPEKTAATEEEKLPEEKKSAKDLLSEKLMQGVKDLMESDNYKNWLVTSSSYFTNNYSLGNAVLIYMQKPDATYVKGYEAWKEFGRNVRQGAKGMKIFVPVIAYDKTEGALYRMIMSNLREQVKQNPGQIAAFRVGTSSIEFTMNPREQVGLRINGRERGIFQDYREVKRYISNAILNKVPMYYTVGTVFDVKDTIVPERLWVKRGYTNDEVVNDKDGKPITNRKGEVQIINTPERQGRFKPSLELSISEPKNPEKMSVLYDVLKTVSARNGIPVTDVARDSDETLKGGADGYFSRRFTEANPKGFIVMPDDLEPTRKCAVLLHEMGHSDLHGDLAKLAALMGEKSIPRHIREIQAESVAYATASQFGIETDTSSFQYLAEYTRGFELQDLKKSLDVIYGECRKLTQEIGAELDARGLNLDLTERDKEPMEVETVKTLSKQYTAYALEQSEAVSSKLKELPSIAADNRRKPELLDVVKEQQKCMDRQMGAVNAIHADVKALQGANTREEQTTALERLEASRRYIEDEKNAFVGLVESFAEVSSQSKATLKEEFSRDPLATLESMKKDYPKLDSLSTLQLAYIAKSEYVKKAYANFLKNEPDKFVEMASRRAEALDKAVAKNGTFVEVNFCEQWTDEPIVQSGAIIHPKIADTIIKQAEVQIRGLKAEAEKAGDYFPYNKCDLTVFFKDGRGLAAYQARVDIGDGGQTSLTDHLTQLCGKESDLVTAFEKATRERGAKEKIVFNDAPETLKAPEIALADMERTQEASTFENWENAIEQEKTGTESQVQEEESIDRDKSLNKDNKEH